jgi:L-gulonate 5-dehydrogenase
VSVRRVVLERPGEVRLVVGGQPSASPGEALVRLRAAGICGSDLSAFRGTSPLVSYPRVLGHEVLVDVLQASERPELEGQRAVLDPMIPCAYCRACRAGRSNCCVRLQVMGVHVDGGLQETYAVDANRLYPVPADLPDEVAVLAEPLTIAYHAVQRSAISAGQIGVVFGAGAIGLLIARLLVGARGCRAFVVDVDADRLRVAAEVGAVPLQGDEAALVQALEEATDGDMADVVFEASGNAVATRTTTALAGHGGSIVLVGWNRGPVEFDTVTLMRKELTVAGSRNSFNAFPAVLRLLADGLVDPKSLITHRFAFGDTVEALQVLDQNQGAALKVLITNESS